MAHFTYDPLGTTTNGVVTTGKTSYILDTTISSDNFHFKVYPCGCLGQFEYATPSNKFNLKCFSCEKVLCDKCAIIKKEENNAGIWCKDCADACKILPFTRKEVMEKLYSMLVDSARNIKNQESETSDLDTQLNSD